MSMVSRMLLFLLILTGCSEDSFVEESDFFVLDGGTYPVEIEVLINSDVEAAAQYVRDNLDSTVTACDFDGAAGLTFDFQDGKPGIIWLESAHDPGLVNHELLHATINTMRHSGLSLSDSSEEAYAYQLQYLTTQFYNKIKP